MIQDRNLQVTTPNDTDILLTRMFDAPRELVWDAIMKPELLKRWMQGPPGWTTIACENDVRVGGSFRYEWSGPGGESLAMTGEYIEVQSPRRVVRTERFHMGEGVPPMEQHGTLELTPEPGNPRRTRFTLTLRFPTREARDGMLASGMSEGAEASYAKLDELLARSAV